MVSKGKLSAVLGARGDQGHVSVPAPVPFSPPLTSQSAFSLSILLLRAALGATIPFLLCPQRLLEPSMWKRRGGILVVWYLEEEISGCFPSLGGLTVRAQGEVLSLAPQLPHPLRRSSLLSAVLQGLPWSLGTESSAAPQGMVPLRSSGQSWGSPEGSMGPGHRTSLRTPRPFLAQGE